ncbi:MAG: hypothetical protein JWN44_6774 [Myxococcales bacterium]|nr:hypothetical protein [Myxococcales bacterium]
MRRLLVCLILLAGCSRRHSSGGREFVQPHYADGAAGLKQMWSEILVAGKNDDRERIHDLLATTLCTDVEMKRLFGAKADALLPRYHQLMGTLINRGAVEFAGNVYEHKYDAIDTFADDSDTPLEAAMVETHPLFSARVRKNADSRGLRYDAFFYLDGRWRTLNQLGKFVDIVK